MDNPPSPQTLAEQFLTEAPAPYRLVASVMLRNRLDNVLRTFLVALGWHEKVADALQQVAIEREATEDAEFRERCRKAPRSRGETPPVFSSGRE